MPLATGLQYKYYLYFANTFIKTQAKCTGSVWKIIGFLENFLQDGVI
jgi:hypothetical protein